MSERIPAIDALGLKLKGYPQYNCTHYWIYENHDWMLTERQYIYDLTKLTHFDCAAPTEDEIIMWRLSTKPDKDISNMSIEETIIHMKRYSSPFENPDND